jgi:hypothetical protein
MYSPVRLQNRCIVRLESLERGVLISWPVAVQYVLEWMT